MFASSFFALLITVTAGILGLTFLTGASVVLAQIVLVTAWLAFLILAVMGGPEPAQNQSEDQATLRPARRSKNSA